MMAGRHDQEKPYKYKPDGCWSWVVCVASFTSLTIVNGYCMTWGVLLPAVIDHFNETRAKTALVGALTNGGAFCLSPIASYSSARFGFRFTALFGSILSATGLVLSSIVPSLSLMFVTYSSMVGIGFCFIYISGTLVVIKYFLKRRTLAVGIISSSACSGVLVTSKSNSALLETFGLVNTFRAMAISMGISLLCACVFDSSVAPDAKETPRSSLAKKSKKVTYFDLSVLRNKTFAIYTLSFTVVYLAYFVLPVHAVKYADELNIPRHDVTNLYTYLAISQFFSRYLFCYLAKFKAINRFYLYQAAASASGIVFFTVPLATTANYLLVIFIVTGLLDGGLYGISPLLVTDCVDEDRVPAAWGIFVTANTAFAALGPFLAGLMADELGSYIPAFYASGAVTLLGASLIFLTKCACVPTSQRDCDEQVSFTGTETLVVERETVL